MEAVTSHQSGTARVRSLAIAAAAVGVAALIGLGASSGVLSGKRAAAPEEAQVPRSGSKPAEPAVCAVCGVVESIRSVEVYEESSASGGAADPRSSAENPGASAGGAIASGAVSMLDSLSGALSGSPEKGVRKRVVWRVTVRMMDGSYRALSLPSPPVFAVGEKVRVVEGRLVRA